jgi:flavin-dependent dehydrogenase
MEPEYDVAIVGARVAGASLGLLLAEQGRRVLLLDREEFPSDTLSTHYVHPFSISTLERLGVLDDLLTAGFREIRRVRTAIGDCVFEGPITPGRGFGLAPRRNVLDSLLQEHAVRHGAELWTRTVADGLLVEDGMVMGIRAGGQRFAPAWSSAPTGRRRRSPTGSGRSRIARCRRSGRPTTATTTVLCRSRRQPSSSTSAVT